ncbi:MAG: hypothetical protein AABX31_02860 [Nanoarchaeota archaeon]
MTDNSSDYKKGFRRGLVIGIACTAFGSVIVGYITISNKFKDILEYNIQKDTSVLQTTACHERLLPLKQKFKENCEGRLYDDVDQKALEKITTERDQIQQELGCEKEKWICRPIDQYRVQESKTEAVYKLE